MNQAEGARHGAVAQHDERRCKTMRATRFRRAALFAERLAGTGKKVKGREIDVAPCFCTGPCASKAANHWQASAPRRAPVAPRWRRVRDSNPRRTCILNGFQDRRNRPLCQLSNGARLLAPFAALHSLGDSPNLFSRFAPYAHGPLAFRCAPLARRLAKSSFLASLRMLMARSPFATLHSLGDSSRNHFFFARAGFTGVDFTSSTIFAVTSGFALR